MSNELITRNGEVIERVTPDASNLSVLVRAEIDSAIATARQYPRQIRTAINNIEQLATMDEATAEGCIYALNRSGKAIRGPSIRLAEIIAQQWGNCRVDARVIQVDRVNKMIVAEATFHDLETNSATKATIQRRISNARGQIYSDDMIVITGNAACSIARRNAILAGVPKGVWSRGLEAAEQIVRGSAKTLTERRDAAVKAFAHFGMTPEQVFQVMGVKGIEEIGLDELVTLRGTFSALKNGETTVEEVLGVARGPNAPSDHKKLANPLADDPPAKQEASDAAEAAGNDAPGPEDQNAAAEAKPEAKEDPRLNVARQLGAAARKKGAMRKDMPTDYREPGREAEAKAWLAGYDAAEPKKD